MRGRSRSRRAPRQAFSSQMAAWRARHVGFVSQFYNLLAVLSAERNVEVPLLLTKLSRPSARAMCRGPGPGGPSDRASHNPRSCPVDSSSACHRPRPDCRSDPAGV